MVITLLIVLNILNLSHGQTGCSRIPDRSGSSKWYDLSALIGREFIWSDAFSFYKTTICKDTYTDCGRCGGPAGFCQWTSNWADCIGKFSLAIRLDDGTGVELLYDNGDWGNVGRVKILCDPNVEDVTEPEIDTNWKTIILYSKHACLVGPPEPPPPASDCESIKDPGSSAVYNLFPLINHQIFWRQPVMDYFFKASICSNSFLDCKKCETGAGMCRYNSQGNDCIGKFDLGVGLSDQEGVDLFYDLSGPSPGRIRILCDHDVSLSDPIYETNPLHVTLRSKFACKCAWVCVTPYSIP